MRGCVLYMFVRARAEQVMSAKFCPWKAPQTWIGRIGAGIGAFILVGVPANFIIDRVVTKRFALKKTASQESKLPTVYKNVWQMKFNKDSQMAAAGHFKNVLFQHGITDASEFLKWTDVNMYDKKTLAFAAACTAGCLGSAVSWARDIKKAKTLCGSGFTMFMTAASLGLSAKALHLAVTDPTIKRSWKFRNDWIGAYLDGKK